MSYRNLVEFADDSCKFRDDNETGAYSDVADCEFFYEIYVQISVTSAQILVNAGTFCINLLFGGI